MGAAIAAVFAGDLISLFVFWELTAISSVFLIWASRNEDSLQCGVRYLIIQVASGVILLAGALLHYQETKSIEFSNFLVDGELSTATTVILFSFGMKVHSICTMVARCYPKATYSGAVFLSPSQLSWRLCSGTWICGYSFLIPIGGVMTAFPIFFAVLRMTFGCIGIFLE